MPNEFGPGLPGQDPRSHLAQLAEQRGNALGAALGEVLVILKRQLPNLAQIDITVTFDDGLSLGCVATLMSTMSKQEASAVYPGSADVIAAAKTGDALAISADGKSLLLVRRADEPKTRRNPRHKKSTAKPVENPPETGEPQ
jgi:hypothetical protein